MERGFSCKFCRLSDVRDRLWILYSRRAWVCSVTSATSLNAVESKVHVMSVKRSGDILEVIHPRFTSSTLLMNTMAGDLKYTFNELRYMYRV